MCALSTSQPRILVVDDSSMNRDLLTEILSDSYGILQAENGARALEIISQRKNEIDCVLLDLTMAVVNGFEVLEKLNQQKILNSIPVIVISAEEKLEFIRKAYSLGATDYILRPFDQLVVKRKVYNTINLYMNQKKLAKMVCNQVMENERLSDMLISILGHTVEFRNKESNLHILNVSSITKILLQILNESPYEYKFSNKHITLISRASALHDLGKVSIPDAVLNKPGKFTPEEFDEMRKHTTIGFQMLESTVLYKNEPLVKYAKNICRWHHERYDGNGYPDRLVGDEIPIEAQVVSLADVYDALVSERCYKKAYTHEQAVHMINDNECGVFNPKLIHCFNSISNKLPKLISEEINSKLTNELSMLN